MKTNFKAHIEEVLSRGVESIYPGREEVGRRLSEEKELKFYFGVDPSSREIHIGHTVPLLILKRLGQMGHRITILVGDFTAQIGDPTDKMAARTMLSSEEVEANMAGYQDQVKKILSPVKYVIKYNSQWHGKINLKEFLHNVGLTTVQQLLQRDMFQERIKQGKFITLSEFIYPLLQGFDSVALDTDGEVGGNDQTFNMLIGRDLIKNHLQKDKIVVTAKLLSYHKDGAKMSKTSGPVIAVNDEPKIMFDKVMNHVDDEMIKNVFTLCTEKSIEWIDENTDGVDPREAKLKLANELVLMYHGAEAASVASSDYLKVSLNKLPDQIRELEVSKDSKLDEILVVAGFADSKSAAHKLIDQDAVLIDDLKTDKWKLAVKDGAVIKVSHKFIRVRK